MLLGSAFALGGCGGGGDGASEDDAPPPPGGQTGEETVGCLPVERHMLAWSERSTLGFSADELLNALGSESDARLAWSGGGSTPLTLGIERASGSVEFQQRAYVDDASGAEAANELATECNDVVAIPVTLSFDTADGAFAEAWPVTLLAESPTHVSTVTQLDLADVEGTFVVTQVDASRYDRVLGVITLSFGDGSWSGSVTGQAITQGSADPDGVASASHFAIASF